MQWPYCLIISKYPIKYLYYNTNYSPTQLFSILHSSGGAFHEFASKNVYGSPEIQDFSPCLQAPAKILALHTKLRVSPQAC